MNENEFDEKQCRDRDIVFKYGFVIAMCTTTVLYALQDMAKIKMTSYFIFIVSIIIPSTVCIIMLVLKDAYETRRDKSGIFVAITWGIMGVCILTDPLYPLSVIKAQGKLDRNIAQLICGGCMLTVSIAYFGKRLYNKRRYKEKE